MSTSQQSSFNTEQQFSLGLINDAFGLGFHCWWMLGFVLSFGVFTMIFSYVVSVIDTRTDSIAEIVKRSGLLTQAMRNLGETDYNRAERTIERLARVEGARKLLRYPMEHTNI